MSNYKSFRIEAFASGARFRVEVKGLVFWKSGYACTNYFSVSYPTKESALLAVEGYKNRFTIATKIVIYDMAESNIKIFQKY